MAKKINEAQEYSLSAEDRRLLLEQTPAGQRMLLIEQQRATFIALHGSAFDDVKMTTDFTTTQNAACMA
jgi:hypothetical protein